MNLLIRRKMAFRESTRTFAKSDLSFYPGLMRCNLFLSLCVTFTLDRHDPFRFLLPYIVSHTKEDFF